MKAFLLMICFCATGLFASVSWQSNYTTGLNQAESQKKPLFVLFTGSNWCSACMKLEKEVLASEEFDKLKDQFVFVKLDFPMYTEPNATGSAKENATLRQEHGVDRFPTVLVFSPSGQELARVIGVPSDGAKSYAKALK